MLRRLSPGGGAFQSGCSARLFCFELPLGFTTNDGRLSLFMAITGVFTPVLAKHSKAFSLIDCISVGVDRMQRNFEPMQRQVETWQRSELADVTVKVVIYEAFVEGKLEAPKHLARSVHDLYFEPKYEDFRPRTIWSLRDARPTDPSRAALNVL
jgi:hypothetical protein